MVHWTAVLPIDVVRNRYYALRTISYAECIRGIRSFYRAWPIVMVRAVPTNKAGWWLILQKLQRARDILESPLGSDGIWTERMMRKNFPVACKLCDDKFQYQIPPRPEVGINAPLLITFLKPLGCGAFAIVLQRKNILFSHENVEYYKRCMEIMKSMWSLGVIHNDLHTNNFLYDENTNEIKLIDFGTAAIATKKQVIKFQQGIIADICRFTSAFVMMILYPKEISDNGDLLLVQQTILEFQPEIGLFHEGQMISDPAIIRVIEGFCEKHGISEITQPSPDEIKLVSDLMGTPPDFTTTDKGARPFRIRTSSMAYVLPSLLDKLCSFLAIMMLWVALLLFCKHYTENRKMKVLEPLLP